MWCSLRSYIYLYSIRYKNWALEIVWLLVNQQKKNYPKFLIRPTYLLFRRLYGKKGGYRRFGRRATTQPHGLIVLDAKINKPSFCNPAARLLLACLFFCGTATRTGLIPYRLVSGLKKKQVYPLTNLCSFS